MRSIFWFTLLSLALFTSCEQEEIGDVCNLPADIDIECYAIIDAVIDFSYDEIDVLTVNEEALTVYFSFYSTAIRSLLNTDTTRFDQFLAIDSLEHQWLDGFRSDITLRSGIWNSNLKPP